MDRQVSLREFLDTYNTELDEFLQDTDNGKESGAHIYGYTFTIHWNGICCDLGDGATPCNHLIPALENMLDELE